MSKGLKLTDVLITIIIAIVFGIVYKLWTPIYYAVQPLGIHLDQLLYGMWFIAATVAFLIIRKPGVAFLAEVAAASGEFLVGSEFGLEVLIYGVLQGIGAELVFALFLYKRFDMSVAILAAIGSAVGSLLMDVFKGYITDLALWNLTLYVGARVIGSILLAGVLAYFIVKALEKTGVTNLVRPASKSDYDALN
jgi:energy-coupling factor transport system permease protein